MRDPATIAELKEQYKVKIAEMKAHPKEQLQSLVVDTDVFEEEEEDGAGIHGRAKQRDRGNERFTI